MSSYIDAGRDLGQWRPGPVRDAIVAFLAGVTEGPDAVAPADRVAAFDLDGTLMCERPHSISYAFLTALKPDAAPGPGSPSPGVWAEDELANVMVGKTVQEYEDAAARFVADARHPRFGVAWPDLAYAPMVQLVHLLQRLDFAVYVVSGGSRDLLRTFAEPRYGVTRDHVIGNEVKVTFAEGRLVRGPQIIDIDRGPGKPAHLWNRAGRLPLFAAGNTSGDLELLTTARFGLLVHHDDADREYAYADQAILDAASAHGWTVASMAGDWASVF